VATRALHFCLQHGCTCLVSTPYCEEHAPLHAKREDRRVRADLRGYDNDWRRLRDRYIRAHPLCVMCEAEGRVTIAEVVHHIKPIDKSGARMDVNNLMSTCRNCHEKLHGRKREENTWQP